VTLRSAGILAIAGSTRQGSFNARLLEIAIAGAEAVGGNVSRLDLKAYPLPLYDGDVEADGGLPPAAAALKRQIAAHAGLLIASPEYNGSMPPLLVNVLAWTSRPEAGEAPGEVYKGKVAALVSASPAAFGGMRGLAPLSSLLGNLGVLVLPYPIGVGGAPGCFGPGASLVDQVTQQRVAAAGAALATMLRRLVP
jgi:chromate reductase